MFTGIVEAVGRLHRVEESDGLRRLEVEADPAFLEGLDRGDSIAVDGACLTAVAIRGAGFRVDVIGSTLERTLARDYREGDRMNLERALAMGARLEGHLVQGHVDGVGEVIRIRDEGGTRFLQVRVPEAIHAATIPHGSIALNGVSLTVNRLDDDELLEVALIPHTREHTNLGLVEAGDRLNVEGDLIGKYVGRLLRTRERT